MTSKEKTKLEAQGWYFIIQGSFMPYEHTHIYWHMVSPRGIQLEWLASDDEKISGIPHFSVDELVKYEFQEYSAQWRRVVLKEYEAALNKFFDSGCKTTLKKPKVPKLKPLKVP